ncbi:MAG: PotD/PotF family extracellular solute-binding protein [Oscillospiraceae bacterium]
MNNYFKRLIPFVFSSVICTSLLAGCYSDSVNDADEESEETEVRTLTVSDEEYYSKFRGSGISINVYNWGEYISDGSDEGTLNVNAEFTKLTGIKVNYTNYATNEELYAKLKGGGASYDIIIPSDYMISRMIKEDMIQPLDFKNIPNYKYIGEAYKNQAYDPDNAYSVPYTWGTVGIIYDTTLIEEENIDWDILWNEDYADRILMFDNPRDAFAIAEIRLGYSLNSEDPEELENAAELLKEQKKVVQAYVMDEIFDKMGAGEALIAPYYAGDAITLMDEYEDLGFVIPESGTNLFIDAMCIPSGARQKEAAEMYINFMCEPDIAYATTSYIGYSTPNTAAYEMLDDEIKNDGISYLDEEYLAQNTTVFRNLSDEANQKMQDLWTELKSTHDETKNKWLVPLFMFACVILSITILIMRYIKKKKDIF